MLEVDHEIESANVEAAIWQQEAMDQELGTRNDAQVHVTDRTNDWCETSQLYATNHPVVPIPANHCNDTVAVFNVPVNHGVDNGDVVIMPTTHNSDSALVDMPLNGIHDNAAVSMPINQSHDKAVMNTPVTRSHDIGITHDVHKNQGSQQGICGGT